jgi:hypothetical protein
MLHTRSGNAETHMCMWMLCSLVVRFDLGCMPVVWSKISDLFGQIGDCLGCSARFLQLRRSEENQSAETTVSVNKAVPDVLSLLEQASGSSLVGRGGGRRRIDASACLAVLWPAMVAGGEGEQQHAAHRRLLGGDEELWMVHLLFISVSSFVDLHRRVLPSRWHSCHGYPWPWRPIYNLQSEATRCHLLELDA